MQRIRRVRRADLAQNTRRAGAIIVLIALTLPIVLCFVALGVDVAYMQLVRTELRVATDAATRAGGRRLSLSQDPKQAHQEAQRFAEFNSVAGDPLRLANRDIEFGTTVQAEEGGRWQFIPDQNQISAVRVTGSRKAGSLSGPVDLFFGRLMGKATFEPQHVAVTTQIDRDIALVLDRSGSMAAADDESTLGFWRGPKNAPRGWRWGDPVPPKARWLDLEYAVIEFLAELGRTPQSELVSLATFSSTAKLDQELTSDYTLIEVQVNGVSSSFKGGATNISHGMQEAITLLENSDRPLAARTMVVMTDGVWNRGVKPIMVAEEAAARGITVHAVTFSSEADRDTMMQVAEAGGGNYWHAPDGATLLKVFRAIAANSPTLLTE